MGTKVSENIGSMQFFSGGVEKFVSKERYERIVCV